ncbi:MAG: hypothetical protein HZA52_14030, partial [Planctomycetes bacterium]|nr:hypothetical protein [Planctomycetota bacterium]
MKKRAAPFRASPDPEFTERSSGSDPWYRSRRRVAALLAALVLGPAAVALLFVAGIPAAAHWVWENTALLWKIAITGTLVAVGVLLALPTFLAAVQQVEGSATPSQSGRERSARHRRLAKVAAGALTILSIAQAIAGNLVASYIDRERVAALPDAAAFYRNHDLAKVVGDSLRMLILRRRDREAADAPDRAALEELADHAPDAWLKLASDPTSATHPVVHALSEPRLIEFVRDPRAQAIDPTAFADLVGEWERAAGVSLRAETRVALGEEVARDFGISLREAIKHDVVAGGKGGIALQLDVQGEILRRVMEGSNRADPKTRLAMQALDESMGKVRDMLVEVAKSQEAYHQEVVERIRTLDADLQRILGEILAEAKATHAETKATHVDVIETRDATRRLEAGLEDVGRDVDFLRENQEEFLRSLPRSASSAPSRDTSPTSIAAWIREERELRPSRRLTSEASADSAEVKVWINSALRLMNAYVAERAWAEAIPVVRRIVDLAPVQADGGATKNVDSRPCAWPVDVVSGWDQLGVVQFLVAARDTSRAIRFSQGLLSGCRRQAILRPNDPDASRLLVAVLHQHGSALAARGDLSSALASLKEGLERAEDQRQDRETPEALRDVSLSLIKVADVELALGQREQALKRYEES